jgi:hypothetical protein
MYLICKPHSLTSLDFVSALFFDVLIEKDQSIDRMTADLGIRIKLIEQGSPGL